MMLNSVTEIFDMKAMKSLEFDEFYMEPFYTDKDIKEAIHDGKCPVINVNKRKNGEVIEVRVFNSRIVWLKSYVTYDFVGYIDLSIKF